MQTIKKNLSELHKTDKNIRKHSEKQIQEYVRSLKMFGQIRPLVVTEDGEILVGNGMFDALTSMGATDCDVYVVSGLSAAQKRKLMLADNKVYEMGFTDVGMLDDIILDLGGDFDVQGYDPELLNVLVQSPAETTQDVVNYGTFEPELHETKQDNLVQASEISSSPYAPPVRTDNGAFVAPPTVENNDTVKADEDNKQYIICPHCGEKIWL